MTPPVLDMNAIPKEVVGVRAWLYSKGDHHGVLIWFLIAVDDEDLYMGTACRCDLECEAKVMFAYKHNRHEHEQAYVLPESMAVS